MASRSVLPLLLLAALAAALVFSVSARSRAAAQAEPEQTAPQILTTATPEPAPPSSRVSEPPQASKPKPRWRPLASVRPRGRAVAIVRRSVPLRERPNGRVVARADTSTEFGSSRVMSIAAQRGPWLGVVATEMPNGKLAWVHIENPGLRFRRHAYSLHADLSGRWLELRRSGRRIRRITVAIGRPGSETPSGRFAVTDKLSGGNYGPYYGCCILALNGHQPKLPAGWQGGNRLAIHGTNAPGTIGLPASAGCLRAADSDLELLMRRVPLGTPVLIRN
ncbi:MAG TPA: L,D-transpeptidase [Thermoleophilaceae bacterium]